MHTLRAAIQIRFDSHQFVRGLTRASSESVEISGERHVGFIIPRSPPDVPSQLSESVRFSFTLTESQNSEAIGTIVFVHSCFLFNLLPPHVENFLSQNYSISSVSSTFKYNITQAKQIINLLLVNNFYSVISYRRVQKESGKLFYIRFGRSLRSAINCQRKWLTSCARMTCHAR